MSLATRSGSAELKYCIYPSLLLRPACLVSVVVERHQHGGVRMLFPYVSFLFVFFLVGWDLRHQVVRPLLAYCTASDDR
jgi:hypothetical protein